MEKGAEENALVLKLVLVWVSMLPNPVLRLAKLADVPNVVVVVVVVFVVLEGFV